MLLNIIDTKVNSSIIVIIIGASIIGVTSINNKLRPPLKSSLLEYSNKYDEVTIIRKGEKYKAFKYD